MEFLYILFGWSLGLLGHFIIDYIRKRIKLKNIREAFLVELKALEEKLLAGLFHMNSVIGNCDTNFFRWYIPLFNKYTTSKSLPEFPKDLEKNILMGDKDVVQQTLDYMQSFYKGGFALKKYSLPFISSNIDKLQYFDISYSRTILNILGKIDILNESMDDASYFLRKTFDPSIGGENYKIINENKETAHSDIMEHEKSLINEIDSLIKMNLNK